MIYTTDIRIRGFHCDAYGHVNNARWVELLEEVRWGWLDRDMDLSSWKQIDWLNRRNRVCMIQPGVTYGELLEALNAEGMTLSMPLAPRNGKSVLASVMDREPTTWPTSSGISATR